MINRYEFERGVYRIIENGDLTAIANAGGHSLSYVSQQFSPECERESDLFKAARALKALIEHDADRGRKALAYFNHAVGTDANERVPLQEAMLHLKKEGDEFETAAMRGEPLHVIEGEIIDIEEAAKRCKRAIARTRTLAKFKGAAA